MPKKQYNIRWRDSDLAELQRAINNFNAKIRRVEKNNPDAANYLPAKAKRSDLINSISTRQELNRTINSLKRFSKRGAETPVRSTRGAKFTQWEEREFKFKQGIVNAARTRERKRVEEMEVKSRGQGIGVKRAQMGTIKENELRPSKKEPKRMSREEFMRAQLAIDRELQYAARAEMNERFRQNYLKAAREHNLDPRIIEHIENMPINEFVDTALSDEEATITFIYDPVEFKLKEQSIMDVWGIDYEMDSGL